MKNNKKTSNTVSSLASSVLKDKSSSNIQKTLAGSVLSQSNKKR